MLNRNQRNFQVAVAAATPVRTNEPAAGATFQVRRVMSKSSGQIRTTDVAVQTELVIVIVAEDPATADLPDALFIVALPGVPEESV